MPTPTAPQSNPPPPSPPPRAFTQGVGWVYQTVGGVVFLTMMLICCGSALLPPERALRWDLTEVGWHLPGDPPDAPSYSAAHAVTFTVFGGVLFGLALAGMGLGMQAQYPGAPTLGVLVSGAGAVFWLIQAVFFITQLGSVLLSILTLALGVVFLALLGFGLVAWLEMRRNPPPADHEVLPEDYKVPYSHLHQDPPEVRLARELAERRRRLAVEQKELEILEEQLKKRQSDQEQ